MRDVPMHRKAVAEFLGTFALVFAGTGAIVIDETTGGSIGHVGIALTFGMIVSAMIYTFGDVSGAHFNPAVTIGFWAARRIATRTVGLYVFAQMSGAIAASFLLHIIFPLNRALGATFPIGTDWQSFMLEIVLSFFLMLTILNVSTGALEKGITAGIAVGAMVGLEAMFGGPISGASMNPARSLAPALVSGNTHHLWVYLTATVLGMCVAVPACRCVRGTECCSPLKKYPA